MELKFVEQSCNTFIESDPYSQTNMKYRFWYIDLTYYKQIIYQT